MRDKIKGQKYNEKTKSKTKQTKNKNKTRQNKTKNKTTTDKVKIGQVQPHYKSQVNSCPSKWWEDPVSPVATVGLLLFKIQWKVMKRVERTGSLLRQMERIRG